MARGRTVTFGADLTGIAVGNEFTPWRRSGDITSFVLDVNNTQTGAATLKLFVQTTDDPTVPPNDATADLIWNDGVDPPVGLVTFTATGRKWRSVGSGTLILGQFFRFRKNLSAGVTTITVTVRVMAVQTA